LENRAKEDGGREERKGRPSKGKRERKRRIGLQEGNSLKG